MPLASDRVRIGSMRGKRALRGGATAIGLGCAIVAVAFAALPGARFRAPHFYAEHGGHVPYGIALAAAALAIYPDTAWMTLVP